MGKLKEYYFDLYDKRERLVDQVYDLDMAGPIEIGSDAAVQMDSLMDAIHDLDDAIKRIGGEL